MSETVDVVDVLAEPVDALDCFRSESPLTSEARPSALPAARVAATRRPKRRRPARRRFESVLYAGVFAAGLVVGALLTGRGMTSGSTLDPVTPIGTVQKPSEASVNVAAVREEQGTAGSNPTVSGFSAAPVVPDSRSRAAAPATAKRVETAPRPERRQAAGYSGTLIITSTPGGASVFVNGELKGETPLELHGQPAGSRALRLEVDGYATWSRAINVIANDATIVSARLDRVD